MWDLIVSVPDHCLSFYFEGFGFLCSFKANSYRIFGRPWSSRNKLFVFTRLIAEMDCKSGVHSSAQVGYTEVHVFIC